MPPVLDVLWSRSKFGLGRRSETFSVHDTEPFHAGEEPTVPPNLESPAATSSHDFKPPPIEDEDKELHCSLLSEPCLGGANEEKHRRPKFDDVPVPTPPSPGLNPSGATSTPLTASSTNTPLAPLSFSSTSPLSSPSSSPAIKTVPVNTVAIVKKSTSHAGVIAGSVIGSFLFLAMLGIVVLLLVRRRRRRTAPSAEFLMVQGERKASVLPFPNVFVYPSPNNPPSPASMKTKYVFNS